MIVSILQPSYLPWLGYFDMINRCDVFVFYDDVQYDKHGWRNRNKIKVPTGWQWLTVPVITGSRFGQLIYQMEIDNHINWSQKHLKTIKYNYAKSCYYDDYIRYFEKIYAQKWGKLEELNLTLIHLICRLIGITNKHFVCSKELEVTGERSERIVNICQLFGANIYLATNASRAYLDERLFTAAGIKVEYQNYQHPAYPQLYGEFIPHLSVIDLLFNGGFQSLKLLSNK